MATVATGSLGRELYGGRYRLEALAGRGATAEVYRAVDRLLGTAVAIKWLAPGMPKVDSDRLLRGAKLVSRVTHPGVAAVLDLGWRDGRPWLAMEYLPGPGLAALIERGGIGPAAARRWAAAAAGSVAALHERGLVHGDLKPGQFRLRSAEELVLADFGQVAVAGSPNWLPRRATVRYLAPELRSDGPPTPAGDVYALARTLLQLPPLAREPALLMTVRPNPSDRPGAATLQAMLARQR